MLNFLLELEYNLHTTILAAAVGILITALLWLITALIDRSKQAGLRQALEKEQNTSQQQRAQLENTQQKVQELENELDEQVELLQQAEEAQTQAAADKQKLNELDATLQQREHELSQLGQTLQELEKNLNLPQQATNVALQQRVDNLVTQLSKRLIDDAQITAELQQAQKKWAEDLAEKEDTLARLSEKVNLQAEQIAAAEAQLQQQLTADSSVELTEAKQALESQTEKLTALEQQHAQTVSALDSAEQKIQYLEIQIEENTKAMAEMVNANSPQATDTQALTQQYEALEDHIYWINQQIAHTLVLLNQRFDLDVQASAEAEDIWAQPLWQHYEQIIAKITSLPASVPNAASVEVTDSDAQQKLTAQQQQIAQLQTALDTVQKQAVQQQAALQESQQKLADKEAEIANWTKKSVQTKAEPVNADIQKQLNKQQALIDELKRSISGYENHIARLEYDLDIQKSLVQSKGELGEIPNSILKRQAADQARIAELEAKLGIKTAPAPKKSVEKTVAATNVLQPVKGQLDEITNKATHIPEQVKGWLNKFTAVVDKQKNTALADSKSVEDKKAELAPKKAAPASSTKPPVPEPAATQNEPATEQLKGLWKKIKSLP